MGTFEWVHLSLSFLIATLLTVLFGDINVERIYQVINWKILFLIGGMTAFVNAMKNSRGSKYLADTNVNLFGDFGSI